MNIKLNYNIYLLIIGNFISQMGTIIYNIAISWWLIKLTGSAEYISYVLAASLIPAVFLGPISGALVDRINKKATLIWTDVISGCLTIGIGIMVYLNFFNIWLLIIFSFLLGVNITLFKPTARSIMPVIASKEELLKANSLLSSSSAMTKILGPFIGGVILAVPYLGVTGAFIINGFSFIISAICEMFIKYNHIKLESKSVSLLKDIKEGIQYTFSNPFIRDLLLVGFMVNIFLGSLYILLPLYINNFLHESSQLYSYLLTSEAIGGMLIGLILAKANLGASYKNLSWSIILIGVSLTLMSVFTDKLILLFAMCLVGFFQVALDTLFFSYIQINVDKEKLGRVFSIVFMLSTLALQISYVIFGFLGIYILEYAFMLLGVCIVLCSTPLLIQILKERKENKVNHSL
ncbi:MFS transporter [Bacillus cereus]|uniref:MFS transporter n=1 Tax=Bacillus cereus group TaxID=86661 RepID=UPI000B4AD725|nr:MFS transporter [Bacillus cereus]